MLPRVRTGSSLIRHYSLSLHCVIVRRNVFHTTELVNALKQSLFIKIFIQTSSGRRHCNNSSKKRIIIYSFCHREGSVSQEQRIECMAHNLLCTRLSINEISPIINHFYRFLGDCTGVVLREATSENYN